MRPLLLAALALLPLACGSDPAPPDPGVPGVPGAVPVARTDQLREVGLLLGLYSGENRRGPSRPEDLAQYEQGAPLGLQALRSGEIAVVWGASMPGEGDANKPTGVIAYEQKTPAEGGLVLRQNGQIETMTAAQFAAAPKAG